MIDKVKGNVVDMTLDQLSNVDSDIDYTKKAGKFLKINEAGDSIVFDFVDTDTVSHFQNRFLIYYGDPLNINQYVNINNSKQQRVINTDEELEIFYQYFDKIVLTVGDNPTNYINPDRNRLISLLTAQKEDENRIIYGYISIGVSTGWNKNTNTLQVIIDELIDDLGFNGIMIDHAGFDSGVTRERLNTIITYCKAKEINILINASNPHDIYDDDNTIDHFSIALAQVQSTYNATPTISEASYTSFLIEDFIIDTVNIEGSATTENIGGNGNSVIDLQLPHSMIKPETIVLDIDAGADILDTKVDYYTGEFADQINLYIDYETGRLYGSLSFTLTQDILISYDYRNQGGYKNIETLMSFIEDVETYRNSKSIKVFASNNINIAEEDIKKIKDYDYIQQLLSLLLNINATGLINEGYSVTDNNVYLPQYLNEALINQLTFEQNINASKYLYDNANDTIYKTCDSLYLGITYANLTAKNRSLTIKSNFIYDYSKVISISEDESYEIGNVKIWNDGSNGYIKSVIGDLYLESESGNIRSSGKVWNAVYNDIADCLPKKLDKEDIIEYGKCCSFDSEGAYTTNKRSDKKYMGIASDTAGFILKGFVREGEFSIPIALSGYVLAHTDKIYEIGTLLVPNKNGILTKARWYEILLNKPVAKFLRKETAECKIIQMGNIETRLKIENRHWVKVI